MIVLDTDVLTIVQRSDSPELSRLAARIAKSRLGPVCVTIISLEEQVRGWLAFISRAKDPSHQVLAYNRLGAIIEDFQTRPVLPFDPPAVAQLERLIRQRVRVGTMDLKIAAICLARRAILISRNLSDFRKVPDLVVEDGTTA